MKHNHGDTKIPKMGPEPTILSRKEVDALYETLEAVTCALSKLGVDYIVTGGSLLGAIRQHSILFCDDDIDITIIDSTGDMYEQVVQPNLQATLGTDDYQYQIRPWEGGDRIRPKRMSNIFLDLFALREYKSENELREVIGIKKNGQPQSEKYVNRILEKLRQCTANIVGEGKTGPPLYPFWQFTTRKAIEMWTKEVYFPWELFPLDRTLKMGPVTHISGPRMPVLLLKRAFGDDCFDVYYQSISHHQNNNSSIRHNDHRKEDNESDHDLPPLTSEGGTWEGGQKTILEEKHYQPMQPIARQSRRYTMHCKETLFAYLSNQSQLEQQWIKEEKEKRRKSSLSASSSSRVTINNNTSKNGRPNRTIYLDGVFDLFHIGHLEAIENCAKLGNRVIIGITGDEDATGYKRRPIVPQKERIAIIRALKEVDEIVCPCPLVVTKEFMDSKGIDLVVHGFANPQDAKRQEEFFKIPMELGKFQEIPYYYGLSTTDRIRNIQQLNNEIDKETQEEIEGNGDSSSSSNSSNNNNNKSQNGINTKQQWFGSTVAKLTNNSSSIPYDPFPLELRITIEVHIRKATKRREEALSAIRIATGFGTYDSTMNGFRTLRFAEEMDFAFNTQAYNIRQSLLECFGLPIDYDLRYIHQRPSFPVGESRLCDFEEKDRLLEKLTINYANFQQHYDEFVRTVCIPQLAATTDNNNCDTYYYQSFPCLRMLQPDEFSIGPHSDVAYGHHPCSINFYVPLTDIGGASSLFLENRPGSEDWHPIEGSYGKIAQEISQCGNEPSL